MMEKKCSVCVCAYTRKRELKVLSNSLIKHQQCLFMVLIVLTPLKYSYSEEKSSSYLSIKILIGFTGPFSVQKAGKQNSRSDFAICQDCAYKMVFLLKISA